MAEPLTTLNVRVEENRTRYSYGLRASDGVTEPLPQEYSVHVNPTFVSRVCARVDKALEKSLPEHRTELAKCGKALYNHLFPPVGGNVPELVNKLHESTGPLLVSTNETQIPWELLHDGQEFLGLNRALGRSSVVPQAPVPGRTGGNLKQALVVGDPLGDLDSARREAEQVVEWLRSRGTQCTLLLGEQATLDDVVMELQANPFDLFHYCGHVALARDSSESGLVLHQRSLLDQWALQGVAEFGAPPVVFINGCGGAGPIANLCLSFMKMGAKTVVGARADVAEASALRFAEEFYYRLLADQPAGAALREARLALADEPDPAWASFLLYGDPSVRITGGGQPPPQPATERTYAFTADAERLMAQVYTTSRRRGVATSWGLLLGLITSDDLRPAIVATVGAERLSLLTEFLYTYMTDNSRDEEDGDDGDRRVEPSDTVVNVLVQARSRMVAEGRNAITSQDIAAAFVEVGGGSSIRLLELCKVSLRQLMPGDAQPNTKPAAELFGELFNGDGRIRADRLDRDAVHAIRAARLLAKAGGGVIGTYILLQGFALAGSRVLRQGLAAQGEAGERALRALSAGLDPRRSGFSRRTLAALEQAQGSMAGPVLGEVEILRALLSESGSSARALLRELGVDPDALIRDLRRPD